MDLLKNLLFTQVKRSPVHPTQGRGRRSPPLEKEKEKPLRFPALFLMANYVIRTSAVWWCAGRDHDWFIAMDNAVLCDEGKPFEFVRKVIPVNVSTPPLPTEWAMTASPVWRWTVSNGWLVVHSACTTSCCCGNFPKPLFDHFVAQLESSSTTSSQDADRDLGAASPQWADELRDCGGGDPVKKVSSTRSSPTVSGTRPDAGTADAPNASRCIRCSSTGRVTAGPAEQHVEMGSAAERLGAWNRSHRLEKEHILPDKPKDDLAKLGRRTGMV